MRTTPELQKQEVKLDKELQCLSSTYVRGNGIARITRDNLVQIGTYTMCWKALPDSTAPMDIQCRA